MNHRRHRRVLLGIVWALGVIISIDLATQHRGGAVTMVVVLAVLGGTVGFMVMARARRWHHKGYQPLLAVLAACLPSSCAGGWAELMHHDLRQLAPHDRRHLLRELLWTAPPSWRQAWFGHWQHTHALRYRGTDAALVIDLRRELVAPASVGQLHGEYAVLHAIGLSRARQGLPVRCVPAMVLARHLLSTRSPALSDARDHARALLASRHQAHFLAHQRRHDHRTAQNEDGEVRYPGRLDALREQVREQVLALQWELHAFSPEPTTADTDRTTVALAIGRGPRRSFGVRVEGLILPRRARRPSPDVADTKTMNDDRPPVGPAAPAVGPEAVRRAPRHRRPAVAPPETPQPGTPAVAADMKRSVFVVHGRDDQVRRRFYDFLRALNLWPLEWEPLVRSTGTASPFLLDVVEGGLMQAQAVLVLLTPDDVVHLHPSLHGPREHAFETAAAGQPRPNVMLELGMAQARCPERTVIVEIGQLRPIADLQGLNVIRFDGSTAALHKIVQRLKGAGCPIDDRGADWQNLERFAQLHAYDRQPVPIAQSYGEVTGQRWNATVPVRRPRPPQGRHQQGPVAK